MTEIIRQTDFEKIIQYHKTCESLQLEFSDCIFMNIKIKNTTIYNFSFINCNFINTGFLNCQFTGMSFRKCKFSRIAFMECRFNTIETVDCKGEASMIINSFLKDVVITDGNYTGFYVMRSLYYKLLINHVLIGNKTGLPDPNLILEKLNRECVAYVDENQTEKGSTIIDIDALDCFYDISEPYKHTINFHKKRYKDYDIPISLATTFLRVEKELLQSKEQREFKLMKKSFDLLYSYLSLEIENYKSYNSTVSKIIDGASPDAEKIDTQKIYSDLVNNDVNN